MKQLARSSKQIGAALRRYRREHKITQTALAERAGLRQGTISLLESGADDAKLSTLMSVLRVLDIELVIQPRSKGSHHDIEEMF